MVNTSSLQWQELYYRIGSILDISFECQGESHCFVLQDTRQLYESIVEIIWSAIKQNALYT